MKRIAAFTASLLLCLSLVGCKDNKAQFYTDYIRSTLECTYYGIERDYAKNVGITNDKAMDIYREEVDYMVDLICYYFAVESDFLTEELADGYELLAIDVLNKAKFTVDKAVKSGDTYHVTVHCEPMNFWDIAYDDVNQLYVDEFAEQFEVVGNSEAYQRLETEYADRALDILTSCVDKIGYGEPVKKIVEITTDEDGNEGITDQDWIDIDELILGKEE